MVVPAVRIVIGDDDRSVLPVRLLFQEVHHAGDEGLLVDRIGVTRVRVGNRRRLQEADRRIVARGHSGEEVVHVVLVMHRRRGVVQRIGKANCSHRRRTGVCKILRARVVLEPRMVLNIVGLVLPQHAREGRPRAAGRAVRVDRGQVEPAHEPAPGNVGRIEQIANVLRGHRCRRRGLGLNRTGVAGRVQVTHQRPAALEVIDHIRRRVGRHAARYHCAVARDHGAVVLTRYHGDCARRRRTIRVGIGVVAHREVLRVVPQTRHSIAVVVAHHEAQRAEFARGTRRVVTRIQRVQVHLAAVGSKLFRRVAVVLTLRAGLGAVEAERIDVGAGRIRRVSDGRIRVQQRGRQTVDCRRAGYRGKRRLACGVRRTRVGTEVVVERFVLTKDHHDVLDRRRGLQCILRGHDRRGCAALDVAAASGQRK